MARKIMVIRHAEKPIPGRVHGVRQRGAVDDCALSVRGWQRTGALIRFFLQPDHPAISVPDHLVAATYDRSAGDGSRRPRQTLIPLAHAMGVKINATFTKHQEAQAAAHCHALEGVVLVSWHHECIPALAKAIAPEVQVPPHWPDECFDRVWVFEPARGGWTFQQVPQRLLAGDAESVA
jgi:hypothetical protein